MDGALDICIFIAVIDGDIPVPGAATKADPIAESGASSDTVHFAVRGVARVGERGGASGVGLSGHFCRHLTRGHLWRAGLCQCLLLARPRPPLSPTREGVQDRMCRVRGYLWVRSSDLLFLDSFLPYQP